jgi:hypothetical protein
VAEFADRGLWPPRVPSVVLVECLSGNAGRDAKTNRLLKVCYIDEIVDVVLARRAAGLRYIARMGSAVDAVVVASAEPHGTVLTSDRRDIVALAAAASGAVQVVSV